MTEMNPERVNTFDPIGVAQDLNAIVDLYAHLLTEAFHEANSGLMPGGLAMVALAPVANQEAWEHQIEAAESHDKADHIVDEDDSWEPPLQTLCFWSEQWRTIHEAEYGQQVTIASEANFIKWALPWAMVHEPRLQDMAEDVRKARSRIENILRDGNRDIVSDDVTCLICESRLRRRMTRNGYEDEWWCIDCHHHLTGAQFNLAASEAARRQLAAQHPDLNLS